MRVTIKDIAEYTKLSITTVSLVLNNKPSRITEETRRAVFDAAAKLNYTPNQMAVGLARKRTRMLGLIIGDLENYFFASLATAVESACNKRGWQMLLCSTSNRHSRDIEAIKLLVSRGVDGVLYNMSTDCTVEKAWQSKEIFEQYVLPVVIVDRSFHMEGENAVMIDHEMGGYLATKHLLNHGHRDIFCLTGPKHLSCSQNRLMGYRRALEEWDIPYNPQYTIRGDYTMQSGISAAETIARLSGTAVFAHNDMMAFGLYKAQSKMRKKIPNEISIVGYDDISFCELLDPPLTTIRQPVHELGEAAVDRLIRVIEGEKDTKTQLFPPSLVERGSVINHHTNQIITNIL